MQTVYPINPMVEDDYLSNISGRWNKKLEKYYPNIKCIQKNTEYKKSFVCFNYALNGIVYYNPINCQDGYYILKDNFKQIPIEQARKGDILSYHEISDFKSKYEKPCAENCLHFAVIFKTDRTIDNTIIKSKWGIDGIFKGKINDVPDTYGNTIVVWRRK